MEIIKNIIPENLWSRLCPYYMNPEFIVIHNTYNDAPAKNERAYMPNNPYNVSFHFAVDDKQIIQCLPLDRNGWHAGDGATGRGNRKGIAIEICYSFSGGERFLNAEKLAAKLTAKLLKDYGWGIEKVKKHQDFSGKYCPHRTLDLGWSRFLDLVKSEMDTQKVGWILDETGWWYATETGGYLKNTWKYINDNWYYFNESGYAIQNEWFKYSDNWYYFNNDCKMVTNSFFEINNKTYYFDEFGICKLNYLQEIDGKIYVFNSKGELIKNKIIDENGILK